MVYVRTSSKKVNDADIVFSNVTTNNASPTKHGFAPLLSNIATEYLNGQGAWSTPAGGSGGALGAYSYLIQINGADCEAYSSAGVLTYGGATDEGGVDGANHAAVIQAAINALPTANVRTGIIFFKVGTYNIAADITIGVQTQIIGESVQGVIFNVTANLTNGCFVITSSAGLSSGWNFSNFRIDLNQMNGNGIYSIYACRATGYKKHRMQDLIILEVKAGYAGIDLTNLFHASIDNILITTYNDGIVIRSDETMNWGNSALNNIYISLLANDCIGMDIIGGAGSEDKALNVSTINRFQTYQAAGAYTGTIGLRITNDADITLTQLDIEHAKYGVYLDTCHRIMFVNPYIFNTIAAECACVYLTGVCYQCNMVGGTLLTGDNAAAIAWDDNSTPSGARRNYITSGANVQYRYDLTNTYVRESYLWGNGASKRSENMGTSTGTGAQQTIAHGLGKTPVYVFLSNIEDGANAYQSAAADGTNIYITAVNGKDYSWSAFITG